MPTKSKSKRPPVCVGLITLKEWHFDLSLVPRLARGQAALIFRSQLSSLTPFSPTRMFVYHFEGERRGEIEVSTKIKSGIDIGCTLKNGS